MHPTARLCRNLIAIMLATAPAYGEASERLPRFPRNTEYGNARQSLMALGWQPIKLEGADECMSGDDRCEGRPEMHTCSGTGMAFCAFTWRRRDTLIEIITAGEGPAFVHRIKCRVGC